VPAYVVFIKQISSLHSRIGEQLFCIWLGHGAASQQSQAPAFCCQVPPSPAFSCQMPASPGQGRAAATSPGQGSSSSALLPAAASQAPCGHAGAAWGVVPQAPPLG